MAVDVSTTPVPGGGTPKFLFAGRDVGRDVGSTQLWPTLVVNRRAWGPPAVPDAKTNCCQEKARGWGYLGSQERRWRFRCIWSALPTTRQQPSRHTAIGSRNSCAASTAT